MKLPDLLMGIFLAVSAALLNATIGIFSKVLMEQGLSVQHIAFLKTLTGFVLSAFCFAVPVLPDRLRIFQKRKRQSCRCC